MGSVLAAHIGITDDGIVPGIVISTYLDQGILLM
jgi:hypothetical protein